MQSGDVFPSLKLFRDSRCEIWETKFSFESCISAHLTSFCDFFLCQNRAKFAKEFLTQLFGRNLYIVLPKFVFKGGNFAGWGKNSGVVGSTFLTHLLFFLFFLAKYRK